MTHKLSKLRNMPIFQYVEAMDKEHLCRNFFRDAAGFTKGWEDSLEETATDGIYDPAAAGDTEPQIMANAVKYEPQETGGIII